MRNEVLRIQNLNIPYSAGRSFKWVSLILFEGECTAFLGLSFSGKDFLLKILTAQEGIEPAGAGIHIDGKRISSRKQLEAGVYRMSPENLSFREWSCADYIGLAGSGWLQMGRQKKVLQQETQRLADSMGIDLDVRRKLSSLSEKEKRLADLLRACSLGARVLVIEDEFEGFTKEELAEFSGLLHTVAKRQHLTAVLNIYSNEVFRLLADHYIVFRDGRIIKKCRSAEITRGEELEEYLLGTSMAQRMSFLRRGAGLARNAAEDGEDERGEVIYRMRNFPLAGHMSVEIKGKTRAVQREDYLDLSFQRGEVTTILAMDERIRVRLFMSLSGRDPDAGVYCVIGERRLKGGEYRLFVKNRVVSVMHPGNSDELFTNMNIGENLVLPSVRKISFSDYLLSSAQLTKALDRDQVLENVFGDSLRESDVNDRIAVAFERWYMFNPRVLVLLEPFEQCDAYGISIVRAYIMKFAGRGASVIMVRSRDEYAEDISDKIIRIL